MTRSEKRALRVALFVVITTALTGCIIIPVDYHDAGVRHNVTKETQHRLQPGVTSKRDVFLTLGEPDFSSEDNARIGYTWTKVKLLILWGSYGGGGGEEIKRSYILEISFTNDVVHTARVVKEWGSQVSPLNELKADASGTH